MSLYVHAHSVCILCMFPPYVCLLRVYAPLYYYSFMCTFPPCICPPHVYVPSCACPLRTYVCSVFMPPPWIRLPPCVCRYCCSFPCMFLRIVVLSMGMSLREYVPPWVCPSASMSLREYVPPRVCPSACFHVYVPLCVPVYICILRACILRPYIHSCVLRFHHADSILLHSTEFIVRCVVLKMDRAAESSHPKV